MNSTLFLNYITCVDHAYIDERGCVVGGSYHPCFEVTGRVEEVENVVVDFSRVKKEIKALIDDKQFGFDHKLWIIDGLSNCSYGINDSTGVITITTPVTSLQMPLNAVKIFDHVSYAESVDDTFERELNVFLTERLGALHPDLNISVKTHNSTLCFSRVAFPFMFRYSHGLKNSSSWGCQNHSHGHLSWFEFEFLNDDRPIDWDALDDVNDEMDDTLFIFAENITENSDTHLAIQYVTERGTFVARYQKDAYKIRVLETETTIEHIAEWFVAEYKTTLQEHGIKRVLISEGLAKGAIVEV